MSINIPLIEVYGTVKFILLVTLYMIYIIGMSEATGPVTTNLIRAGLWKVGTIGWPVSGVEVKLHEKNNNGEGEVILTALNINHLTLLMSNQLLINEVELRNCLHFICIVVEVLSSFVS